MSKPNLNQLNKLDNKNKLIEFISIIDPYLTSLGPRESNFTENYYDEIFTADTNKLFHMIYQINDNMAPKKAEIITDIICAYAGLNKTNVMENFNIYNYNQTNPERKENYKNMNLTSGADQYRAIKNVENIITDNLVNNYFSNAFIKTNLDVNEFNDDHKRYLNRPTSLNIHETLAILEDLLKDYFDYFDNEGKRTFGVQSDDMKALRISGTKVLTAIKKVNIEGVNSSTLNNLKTMCDDLKSKAEIYIRNKDNEKPLNERSEIGQNRYNKVKKIESFASNLNTAINNVSFVNDHIPKLFLLGGEQIHICHINSHVSEDNANIIGLINDKQNMSDKLDLIFKYTVTNKLGLTVTQNNKLQIQSKLLMNLVTTNGEFDSNKFESFKQTYASKLKMMNIQIGKDVITQYNSLKNDRKYDHIDNDIKIIIAEKRANASYPALIKNSISTEISSFVSQLNTKFGVDAKTELNEIIDLKMDSVNDSKDSRYISLANSISRAITIPDAKLNAQISDKELWIDSANYSAEKALSYSDKIAEGKLEPSIGEWKKTKFPVGHRIASTFFGGDRAELYGFICSIEDKMTKKAYKNILYSDKTPDDNLKNKLIDDIKIYNQSKIMENSVSKIHSENKKAALKELNTIKDNHYTNTVNYIKSLDTKYAEHFKKMAISLCDLFFKDFPGKRDFTIERINKTGDLKIPIFKNETINDSDFDYKFAATIFTAQLKQYPEYSTIIDSYQSTIESYELFHKECQNCIEKKVSELNPSDFTKTLVALNSINNSIARLSYHANSDTKELKPACDLITNELAVDCKNFKENLKTLESNIKNDSLKKISEINANTSTSIINEAPVKNTSSKKSIDKVISSAGKSKEAPELKSKITLP